MAKKSRLIFSPVSLIDLQRINEFYSSINVRVRAQALARLAEGFKVIERFPSIGRTINKSGVKEFVVPFCKGNFFIRYREQKNAIHIAHLWHSLEDEE